MYQAQLAFTNGDFVARHCLSLPVGVLAKMTERKHRRIGVSRVSCIIRTSVALTRRGVSRCCASHFSLLAQSKVAKRKGTLHCVDAAHRCLALLARNGAAGTRCAQTSGCFFPSWLCCSAQRQGVEYSRQRDWPACVLALNTGRERRVIGRC